MKRLALSALLLSTLALTEAPPLKAAPPPDGDLSAIMRRVEEVRGLRFKRPVDRVTVTAEGMKQELRRQMEQEYKPADWAPLEATLKAFRLIPATGSLKALLGSLLEQQAAGLYDPRAKRLFVLKGGGASGGGALEDILGEAGLSMGDASLAHELAHALDDQHFDLLSLPVEERYDQDRAGAAMAVVEGDATWVMMQFMAGSLGMEAGSLDGLDEFVGSEGTGGLEGLSGLGGAEGLGDLGDLGGLLGGTDLGMGEGVPRYLKENLLGAYLDGLSFVKAVRARGGAAAVDALFRTPPASVEQVLHPAKYFAGEAPARFTVQMPPAWTPAGYRPYTSGVWGELNTRIILLEMNIPPPEAKVASEGWGGDAYATARGPAGAMAWVWVTRWDSERDAKEFRDALSRSPSLKVTQSGSEVTAVFGGPVPKK